MINWKTIGILTDKIILGTDGISNQDPQKKSRAILKNEDGKFAVIYEKNSDTHTLPGGSLEPCENEVSALIREIHEETGCTCDTIEPLGIVHENRYHANTTRMTCYFVVHTKTRQGILHLTEEEIKLGTTVKWCSLKEMIQLINKVECETNQRKFQRARDMAAISEYLKINHIINN